ncbi:hypothetical protein [Lutibacter sp.]
MHKKLEAELMSLAHSILKLKNKDDVIALHKKAHELYEKLSVLKFVSEFKNTTPNISEESREMIQDIENHFKTEATVKVEESPVYVEEEKQNKVENIQENAVEDTVFKTVDAVEENTREEETVIKQTSLEEELKDAVLADVSAELFEKVTKENPEVEADFTGKKQSLNDSLFKNNLQIGLNDRIAFVKHLFDGSQEDFNRVLSQLNTFKTQQEAVTFINTIVKPDYNWEAKEEYVDRLFTLIERKFT